MLKEIKNELILNDYPHVQFIYIQENSLKYISSLTISNLPELQQIRIKNDSFSETTNLILKRIYLII